MNSALRPAARLGRAWFTLSAVGLVSASLVTRAAPPEENLPARIVVTDNTVAPSPEPFGQNFQNYHQFAFNDLTRGSTIAGYEGVFRKVRYFASEVGTNADGTRWFDSADINSEIGDSYWTGATAYIYRRSATTDEYQQVASAQVQLSKLNRAFTLASFGVEDDTNSSTRIRGGKTQKVSFEGVIRVQPGQTSFRYVDGRSAYYYNQGDLDNGVTYYYTVRAIDSGGNWSGNSVSASATPLASISTGPKLVSHQAWREDARIVQGAVGPSKNFYIESTGGSGALTWQIVGGSLPANLEFGSESVSQRTKAFVRLKSGATATAADAAPFTLQVKVTDALGRSDTGTILVNPAGPALDPNGVDTTAPSAPTGLSATALNGAVELAWNASSSSDVVGYAVFRSRFPDNDQSNRIILPASTPALQVNDLVFLEKTFDYTYANRALAAERTPYRVYETGGDLGWKTSLSNTSYQKWNGARNPGLPPELQYSQVAHPGAKPAEFQPLAGDRCAKVTVPAGWGISTNLTTIDADNTKFFYRFMEQGKTYRARVWVFQDSGAAANVKLAAPGVPNLSGLPVTVSVPSGAWTEISATITPSGVDSSGQPDYVTLEFGSTTAANFYFDAFQLFEVDPATPPGAMYPYWKQELARFFERPAESTDPKPTLRYWALQSNAAVGASLDEALKPVILRRGTNNMDAQSLPAFLQLCKDVGAEPWIIASMSLLERDYRNLIEYLAGPADSTTYGAKRKEDRGGITTPWTDEFARIHIECDNESWNSKFGFYFNNDATGYGRFAEMLFQSMKSRPFWNSSLDAKIIFVGNGFNGGATYGANAAAAAPSVELVDVAPYLGGWESGSYIGGSVVNDTGFGKWLVYAPWKHYGEVAGHVAEQTRVNNGRATPYRLGVYEGGPGYKQPDSSGVADPVDEAYGKSLAAAITTLDCYLQESYRGYAAQAYFGFTAGTNWSSHAFDPTNVLVNGKSYPSSMAFQRHPTFLAMYLRNKYATGGMVQTYDLSMPNRDLPAEAGQPARADVPLIGTYAFRQGNRYAVIVFSRRLDERDANGVVTDEAITPVTLQLPFTSATSVELHRIVGDPRLTNVPSLSNFDRNKLITIQDLTLPAGSVAANGEFAIDATTGGVASSDGLRVGLPAGGFYVYVFDGVNSPAKPTQPVATIARATTQPQATFGSSAEFLLTFDRPVTGLANTDISLANSTANVSAASVTVASLDPLLANSAGASTSVAWKVTVSGFTGSGLIQIDLPAGSVTALSGGAANTAASGASARVQTIAGSVVFDWNINNLPAGARDDTPSARYSGTTPTQERALLFSDSNPIFAPAAARAGLIQPVYGGIHARRESGANPSGGVLTDVMLATREGLTGGANYPGVSAAYFASNGDGGAFVSAAGVFFWKKAQFGLANASTPLAFNGGTVLSFDVQSIGWISSASLRQFRFLVQDGANYYISEDTFGSGTGTVRISEFNNSARRWAQVTFANDSSGFATTLQNAAALTYASRAFTNVQALGFTAVTRAPNFAKAGFTRFTATTVTDTTPYLAYDLATPSSTVRGSTLELTASAIDADTASLTYTWRVVSGPAGGATFVGGITSTAAPGTLAAKRVNVTANGLYRFRVDVNDGTTTRQSSTIDVAVDNPAFAPVIGTQPATVKVGVGGTGTFTASAYGATSLQWEKSQTNAAGSWSAIPGATGGTLMITNATADSLAYYRLKATNSLGTVYSSVASLASGDMRTSLVARYAFETDTLGADSAGTATAKNGSVVGTGLSRQTTGAAVGTSLLKNSAASNTATAGRIEVPDHPDLDGSANYSITFWVRPDATVGSGTLRGLVSKRVAIANQAAYCLMLGTDNKLQMDVPGSTSRFTVGTSVIPTDKATHVAWVFEDIAGANTGRVRVYLNGQLINTWSVTADAVPNTTAPLHLGKQDAQVSTGSYSFAGLLDDVRLYKGKSLTDDEVVFIYENTE